MVCKLVTYLRRGCGSVAQPHDATSRLIHLTTTYKLCRRFHGQTRVSSENGTSTCRASTHIRNDTPHSHPPPPKSPTDTTCLHADPSRFTSVPVSGLRQHSPRSVVHERDVGLVPRGHDRQLCHRVPRALPASRHVCMWVVRQGYPDVASFECVCNVSNDKSGNFLFVIFAIFSVE